MTHMPNPYKPYQNTGAFGYQGAGEDSLAIARFFNAVYAWMFAGLALTALVAYFVAAHPVILQNIGQGGVIGLFIVEVILVGTISMAVNRINAAVATLLFLLYAGINGIVLSVILLVYTQASVGSAFAITAGMFAAMSVYGFVTGRDLTGLGSVLYMALVGMVIASVVSFFWSSSILQTLINYVGVVVFTGLTAYDTQKLKQLAIATSGNAAVAARMSINGALMLYLDFINLFIVLVQILGDRDRR